MLTEFNDNLYHTKERNIFNQEILDNYAARIQ